ncbi:sulfite exporter TauE/SafE family protein [Rubrobacter indicoceani]|uniref:sulfite exporter TauE/SafE family protein n=1 Tax=Rubrobacter indicoceani TaxID=2051957 RepID=UPI000E5AF783|nr:sulfite exporter TauE/SafE family protein [Rubrobacter indicoceani]
MLETVLFGLLVGFLVGLTGVGGGSLMSPYLLAIGVPAPTAIGTDLIFATITKLFGSASHYRLKSINFQVVLYLALGSVPAGLLGVVTVNWLQTVLPAETVEYYLKTAIGSVVVFVGATLILRFFIPERGERGDTPVWDGFSKMTLKRRTLTVVLGAFAGYLVGLTSIGSGTLIAIILLLLYPLATSVVVGTDIAHATILSLVVGVAHAASGNVNFGLVGTLLIGAVPGVLVGSRLTKVVPGNLLRGILAAMLIFVGTRLVLTA